MEPTVRLRSKLVALPLSAALGAAGLMAVTAAPASASTASLPICTTAYWLTSPATGHLLDMPTTSSKSTSCYLAEGDVSNAVTQLQNSLVACYGSSIITDGDFGPATKAALEAAQRASGATVDGVYGTNTRDHMKFMEVNGGCYKWG